MSRSWSGAIPRADGGAYAGWVTIPDVRAPNLRELLLDLALPGLCIVLGAGASYGVVPVTRKEIAEIAWKMLQSQSNFQVLTTAEHQRLAEHPEVSFLTKLLREVPHDAWDRLLDDYVDLISPGQASLILNDIFTPGCQVPTALVEIYNVLESRDGVLITYNYDRIADHQNNFPVIAPHGKTSASLLDARVGDITRRMAAEFHIAVSTDWHLPVPEDDRVRQRVSYRCMLSAWRHARSIVFIGYGFGSGADAISFQDFGENVAPDTRVHVLCPPPDNADLCRQVGSSLRGRNRGFRIYGHPFRWQAFAEAMLTVLGRIGARHVAAIIGREVEIGIHHDRA
jgi:hypothetical protein